MKFLESLQKAAGKAPHPHLFPVNGPSFQSGCTAALAKAGNLMAYRKYLADARETKAKRKRVSLSFEHSVQVQARHALDDANDMFVSSMDVIQQINHTDLWNEMHRRMSAALKASGPTKLNDIWGEIEQALNNPQYKAAFAEAGLTDDLAAVMTDTFSNIAGTVSVSGDHIVTEVSPPGSTAAGRIRIKPPSEKPAGILDLLARSQFDRVLAAVKNGDPVYLEAVALPAEVACTPTDLFLAGAVSGRQRLAEHVRKLDDTGLATYQGGDPISTTILVVFLSIVAGLIGALLLYSCDLADAAGPGDLANDEALVCGLGFLLLYMATLVLAGAVIIGALAGGAAIAFVAWIAFDFLVVDLLVHWDEYNNYHPPPPSA